MKKIITLMLIVGMVFILGAFTKQATTSYKNNSVSTKTDFNIAFPSDPGDMSPWGTANSAANFVKGNIVFYIFKSLVRKHVRIAKPGKKFNKNGFLVNQQVIF